MPIDKIPLTLIEDNPFQPRRTYHKEDIDSLAASIKANGLLQVPPARRTKGGIQLAFGHLRLRAFKKLAEKSEKWSRMPLDIREITDEDMALFALEENLKRRDITPIDVARALNKYLESFPKQTELQLANKVGMTQGSVSNMRRVLRLPAKVLDKIDEGRITFTMGRELLVLQGFKDEDITDEELMLLAIRGVQVPGSQNDMRKPFTREGIQRSIHEVACARFFTIDKEHADGASYYSGKELLFDAEASGCFKCDKILKTHPTNTGVANWCTDRPCWQKHQEDYKESTIATAPPTEPTAPTAKVIDVDAADERRQREREAEVAKGVAEPENISQEISEPGDSAPAQKPPAVETKVAGQTIQEAIKILGQYAYGGSVTLDQNFKDSVKLGIEALKHIQWERKIKALDTANLLPGETVREVAEGE